MRCPTCDCETLTDCERNEEERREAIAGLSGSGMKCASDPFGQHELLDRAHLVGEMVNDLLVEHPACIVDADLFEKAVHARDVLSDLYQAIGERHLGNDPDAVVVCRK